MTKKDREAILKDIRYILLRAKSTNYHTFLQELYNKYVEKDLKKHSW